MTMSYDCHKMVPQEIAQQKYQGFQIELSLVIWYKLLTHAL